MNWRNEAVIAWGIFVMCGRYMGVNARFGDRLLALGRYFNIREFKVRIFDRVGAKEIAAQKACLGVFYSIFTYLSGDKF
jgi:hypothetical protein